jgi:hypothetical protein
MSKIAAFALAGALVAPAAGAEPLRVYVAAALAPPAQGDPKARVKEVEGRRDAAWSEYDAAFKDMKKKYGKDWDKWTPEQKDEGRRAYEKYVAVATEYLMATIKPKDLADAVEDIMNSFQGKGFAGVKENVVLAESAADAHLVIEALGRYGASKLTVGPKHFVYRVTAGGKLKPAALAAVPRDWPRATWWADEQCSQYHYYRPEEPWIIWKAIDNQRWRDVMNTTSACINDLAKEHGAAILAASK